MRLSRSTAGRSRWSANLRYCPGSHATPASIPQPRSRVDAAAVSPVRPEARPALLLALTDLLARFHQLVRRDMTFRALEQPADRIAARRGRAGRARRNRILARPAGGPYRRVHVVERTVQRPLRRLEPPLRAVVLVG